MKKMSNTEKYIKHLGFYFVRASKCKVFLLCNVTDVENCLLIFTGKSSESLSRIYISVILILVHSKCSTQFLCDVQFSHYIDCYRLISFFYCLLIKTDLRHYGKST